MSAGECRTYPSFTALGYCPLGGTPEEGGKRFCFNIPFRALPAKNKARKRLQSDSACLLRPRRAKAQEESNHGK